MRIPLLLQRETQVVVSAGVVGFQVNSGPELTYGVRDFTFLQQDPAQIRVRLGKIRFDQDGGLESVARGFQVPLSERLQPQVILGHGLGVIRVLFLQAFHFGERSLRLLALSHSLETYSPDYTRPRHTAA